MARFDASQADNYKTQGEGSFFSLANDGDYEQVRLMYNTMKDVELFSVHQVEENGKTYWVNCLREYDQPIDDCPLCKAGNRLQVKMWVPLYLEKTQEVKVWERGRTFLSKLESAERRFSPLVSNIFEIERNGKKGDQNTTYELIHIKRDDVALKDLPEAIEVEGTIVKTLSFDEMENYLDTGKLPNNNEQSPKSRNPVADRRPRSNAEETPVRRTARTRATSEETTEQPF